MSKLPLVEGVLNYTKQNNTLFCMPGHKGGKGFLDNKYGKELYDNIIKTDITEVEGLDNLHNAEGIIKEAQELLSKFYGSSKSYFLVNGSSSGNLTMIFSSFKEGDKVIVERNCHKSIFNGIILRKLKPIFIKNSINKIYNAPLSIDEEHFLRVIKENKDAKGIILTYPNYYGICPNLELIIKEAKKMNMKVLVDSAHGAHFGILEELPENPLKLGADMVVMSCHKTLPSFTQTAYLHLGENQNVSNVELYLHMFLSTSPSYMLMCSMDYARFYLEQYGKQEYSNLIELMSIYRKKINKLKVFHIIGKEDLQQQSIDVTRFVINLEKGYSAEKFSHYLKKEKIQIEMHDGQNVVLIFSPFNKEEDFEKLYNAMKKCCTDKLKVKCTDIIEYDIPQKELEPFEAINQKWSYMNLIQAQGKICADDIVPYPPGVPLVMRGEKIDINIISMIKYYLEIGIDVIGVTSEDGQFKIKVID